MEGKIKTTSNIVTQNALQNPEAPCVMFYDEIVTYKDMDQKTDAFANFLLDTGIGKGDVVSFMLGNNPEFLYCLLGAQKIGAMACPISCWWQAPEVEFLINDAKPKVLIMDPEYTGIASEINDRIPSIRNIIINSPSDMDLDFSHHYLGQILESHSEPLSCSHPPVEKDKAALMYTSGTTGKPKGTVLTHKGIVKAANMKTSSIPILSGDRSLCVLPMFHTGGLFDLVMPCIYKQCTVVLRKNFSATEFWESIEEYKVNAFLVVPTILNILLRTPEADEVDTSSLRFGLSGAAPIPPEQLDECENRFGIPVLEAYGATENTGGITVNRMDQRKTGSVGLEFDEIKVCIFNKKGEPLPAGEIGEIVVKGDTVMHEYYNSPELTAKTIKDGWLHTGDLGYMDDEGFLFIVDRKKDMIIRGGVNVYPKELENIIATHPKVTGVAVIPEPHDKYGQVAKACIVVLRGQTLAEEEIRSFCLEKMAEYKMPEIFLIRESLPTNALGKVIKKDLIKELAEEENAQPVPCAHFFEAMPGRFNPEKAEDIEGTVSYNITGKGGGKWTIHIKDKKMTLTKEVLVTPTVYIVARDADYHDIATGKIDGVTAVMTGKWKIEGDVNFMSQLRELLRPIQD